MFHLNLYAYSLLKWKTIIRDLLEKAYKRSYETKLLSEINWKLSFNVIFQ